MRMMASARAEPMMMMDAEPMMMKLGSAPPKSVEIRTKFPETWLFDNLELDSG